MTVKTEFTPVDFANILAHYDLGTCTQSEPISQGTVQTNYVLHTTQGKYVFRYYENRDRDSVLFESDLLSFLAERRYPCPVQIRNDEGAYVGTYDNKPYTITHFIEGQPIEKPDYTHQQQLIQKAAELQILTQNFHSPYIRHRWNYDSDLCRNLAYDEAKRINTQSAYEKYAWLAHELTKLNLPPALPKGICHCDFHFSNILFHNDTLVALLDFDDANNTYLQFDMVGLIEYWAWSHTAGRLDLARARDVVQEYMKHRPLSLIEQQHLYDVYKLSILFDCVWYFERGSAQNFYEKRKVDALTTLGRQHFTERLFQQ